MISNKDKFKFTVNENPNLNINKDELKKFMKQNEIKDINVFLLQPTSNRKKKLIF